MRKFLAILLTVLLIGTVSFAVFAKGTPESPTQFNSYVDRNYTLTKSVDKVEYKVTCQSLMISDGTKVVTYIGESSGKDENPVVRMAGEDSSGGGSTPVTHHTWIAIVK